MESKFLHRIPAAFWDKRNKNMRTPTVLLKSNQTLGQARVPIGWAWTNQVFCCCSLSLCVMLMFAVSVWLLFNWIHSFIVIALMFHSLQFPLCDSPSTTHWMATQLQNIFFYNHMRGLISYYISNCCALCHYRRYLLTIKYERVRRFIDITRAIINKSGYCSVTGDSLSKKRHPLVSPVRKIINNVQ